MGGGPDPEGGPPRAGRGLVAGKAMAQVGHGAQLLWWATGEADRACWLAGGLALSVRTASGPQWTGLLGAGLPTVRDGGLTELEPGSLTVVGQAPAIRRG